MGLGGMVGLTGVLVVLEIGVGDLLLADFGVGVVFKSDLTGVAALLVSFFGGELLDSGFGDPCFEDISLFGDAAFLSALLGDLGVASGFGDPCLLVVAVVMVGGGETLFSLAVTVLGMAPVSFEIGSFLAVTTFFGVAEALTRTFPATTPGFVPVISFGSNISISNTSEGGGGSSFCCADFSGISSVFASMSPLTCWMLLSFLLRLLVVGLVFFDSMITSFTGVFSDAAASTGFSLI